MTPSPRLAVALLLAGVTAAAWCAQPRADAPGPPPVALSAPYTHDNLTVYVVRGPDAFDAGNVMTLQEALDKGLAVVHETGDVNTLAVENRSDDQELFLQSGDIVKGGKQDRLIAADLILPPRSGKVACPANCCERSRWSGRGAEAADKFAKSTDFAVGNDIKIANATRRQDQVWENVEKAQKQLSENVGKVVNAAESPTSLQLALEDADLRAKLAGYEKALAGVAGYPDALGVVVAVNGKVIAADVYGSAKLFKKVWPKLLKAAAADALAQMPKGGAGLAVPTLREAELFLAAAAAGRPDGPTADAAGLSAAVAAQIVFDVAAEPAVRGHGQLQLLGDGTGVAANPAPQPAAQVAQTADVIRETADLLEQLPASARPARVQAGFTLNELPVTAGRASASRGRTTHADARAGIVVVEAQAPAKPGVTVHRSYLKK